MAQSAADPVRDPGNERTSLADASLRRPLDEALRTLVAHRKAWPRVGIAERLVLLGHVQRDLLGVAEAWTEAATVRQMVPTARARGEQWASGPLVITRVLAGLRSSLRAQAVADSRGPRAAGVDRERRRHGAGSRTVRRVVPTTNVDRLAFTGTSVDVWLSEHPDPPSRHDGAVALVLGAGNVSSISVTDTLEKLFVHDEVVLLKLNPVNDYLRPYVERALEVLIRAGYVRVVVGGSDVGAYLCDHESVETIHVTGSGRTFDAIAFGSGADGAARKAAGKLRLRKPITAELGDISPIIVVPGPWSPRDVDYHAHNVASTISSFASFTCATPRLLIQHDAWARRTGLVEAIESYFARITNRAAYYPGAHERWQTIVDAHPEASQIGEAPDGSLPWTVVRDLDPDTDDVCFTLEPFCSVVSTLDLVADDAASFLDRAVAFVNERLWGSLSVALLVHPRSLADPRVATAVRRAVADLRYGTVAINHMTGIGWSLGVAPWGAYPGNPPSDVGSGIGFTHNPFGLTAIEKSVLRGPFRSYPTPPFFDAHRRYDDVIRHLTHLYAAPDPRRALGLAHALLRGWI